MRSVDTVFLAALQTDKVARMPWLVTVETVDGLVHRFTNWDERKFGTPIYLPYFDARSLETVTFATDGSPSNTVLRFAAGASGFDQGDVMRGRYTDAEVNISLAFADIPASQVLVFTGWLDEVREMPDGKWFVFPVRSIAAWMKTRLTAIAGPMCRSPALGTDHPLYPCPFDVAANTLTGTVDSIVAGTKFAATLSGTPAFSLVDGPLAFTSGDLRYMQPGPMVRTASGSGTGWTFAISHNWGFTMAPGDTFTVSPGCNFTFAKCVELGMANNHNAEHEMPGPDFFASLGATL